MTGTIAIQIHANPSNPCVRSKIPRACSDGLRQLMALKVEPKAESAAVAVDDELYVKRLIADVASEYGLVQIGNPSSDAIVTYRRNSTGLFFKNGVLIALFRSK